MKYQLLWAACFVGLLQLSAVASRSTVDEEIINKENAKYSTTTVGPTVAYTGQEVERGVNSSGKLAVDPGLEPNEFIFQNHQADWGLFAFYCFVAVLFIFHVLLCTYCCVRRRKIKTGRVVRRDSPESRNVQPLSAYNTQNYQLPNIITEKPQLYQATKENPQLQDITNEKQQTSSYQDTMNHQLVPQPLSPMNQLPHQHHGAQHQNLPPTVHEAVKTQHSSSVIEFENPAYIVETEKPPLNDS